MTDRTSFGAWLRRERERRGLTLDVIANRTKIASSLLAGLEEGDLSRWPTGIFRRAFVRAYADAVGLDADYVLAEFTVVHPDVGQASVTVPRRFTAGAVRADNLRLTLDEASRRPWLDQRRLAGVALDGVVFALVLTGLWTLAPGWLGIGLAWLALATYSAVGALVLVDTPGFWLVGRISRARAAHARSLAEDLAADSDAEATVVPFHPARRHRRPRRPSPASERPTRASGEGRARTH